MPKKIKLLSYVAGLLTGVFLSLIILAGVAFFGTRQVMVLRVNTWTLNQRIENATQVILAEVMPVYLAGLETNIPDLVNANMEKQFEDAKIELGGVTFNLPQEFIDQMDENYRTSLINAMTDMVRALPLDELSEEIAREIASIVQQSVLAEYNNRRISINVAGGFKLPFSVELVSQPNGQDFKLIFNSWRRQGHY
jgi:uncharacterized tellurite resistance protein B-like protein